MTPATNPDCDLCGDTGWITRVGMDGDGYEIPCPEGCPTIPLADYEVPF